MTKLLPLVSLGWLLAAPAVLAQTTLHVDQQSLAFTAEVGGAPTSMPLNVTSSPSGAIVLVTAVEQTATQVTWLTATASTGGGGGTTPLSLTVTVNPLNLSAGSYTGSIVIQIFGGGASLTVPVTLTVAAITVTPPSLTFTTSIGVTPSAASVSLGSAQQISFVTAVSTTSGGHWLDVSPPFGIVSGFSAVSAVPDSVVVPTLTPGTYNASITITPTSGTNTTPIVVPVTLTVTPAPAVTVNPPSLNIEYQTGGANNTPQGVLTLNTSNPQGVLFTITATSQPNPSGSVWVLPSPLFGTITPAGTQVTIAYNPSINLPAGNWQSTVTINTPNGTPTATDVPVNLFISAQPLLIVPTTPLSFTYELAMAAPAAQTVTIGTTAATPQSFKVAVSTTDGAAWLVAPTTGATQNPLAVSINPAGLAPGTYTGTVTVTGVGTGDGAHQFTVNLKVANDPAIVGNIASLALPYQLGKLAPAAQPIVLSSSTGAALNYSASSSSATCGGNWLTVSGPTSGPVNVGINSTGLTAGVCTGTVTISAVNPATGSAAINSPVSIPVTLTVSPASLLAVAPLTPAVFTAPAGGAAPAAQTYTFSSTDPTLLNFTATAAATTGGNNWLSVSPASGSTASGSNTIKISVTPGTLAAGTYTGKVTVTATATGDATVADSPLTIPVTFQATTGTLVISLPSLTFQQAITGSAPPNQVVSVTSSGQPVTFAATASNTGSVNWLTASPSGTTPGSVSVSVDGSKLTFGTYTGTVAVVSTTPNIGNSPTVIPVTFTVNAGTISATPPGLEFTQVQGGQPPAAANVSVSASPVPIPFLAALATSSGGAWLGYAPASGTTPGLIQVYVNVNQLTAGVYKGTVTITSTGASGSPITIPVTLSVLPQYSLAVNPSTINFKVAAGSKTPQSTSAQITSSGGAAPFSVTTSGGWLSAAPASGTTPGGITVTADPTGLATGAHSGTATITSPNSLTPVTVTVNLVVGTVAAPVVNAVANAASYGAGSVAPGENVVIFGSGIGPPALVGGTVTNGVVDTSAGATRVLFDGIPAPMIYADAIQTSAMAPYEINGRQTTSVVVEYQGVQSTPIAYSVSPSVPGLYTQSAQGTGPGAILNILPLGYSVNLPNAPALRGSFVAVYMTGEGFTAGAVDGMIATGTLSPVLAVTATVGGIAATVSYAGTSPGIVTGATQVNVQIPMTVKPGPAVPIVITVGTGAAAVSTQMGVTVAVQ